MDATRIHPIWKEVANTIVSRIGVEGYGFLIEHQELLDMLEIKEPTTISEAMKQRLEILKKVEELKNDLLYEHNLLLYNEFNRGYVVLEPDQQVTKGYERQFDKARKKIHKAIDVLTHVSHDMLSQSAKEQRDRNLSKSVFVLSAFNKRKLPEPKQALMVESK
jgi:hypothetical protein